MTIFTWILIAVVIALLVGLFYAFKAIAEFLYGISKIFAH